MEWSEVCGDYDDEVFGDGRGSFGTEGEGVKSVYNSFGSLMAGKPLEDR